MLESAVAGAGRFAAAIRNSSSGRGGSAEAEGTIVSGDRQHVAASAAFAAEAKARSAAALNAAEGSSMLQIADEALASIGIKLDELASLAGESEVGEKSTFERTQLDARFLAVKGEIDTIAAATTFDGVQLLQGGAGPGGEFQVSFKVGTGSDANDDITILIASASVSDLSAGLDTGGIATPCNSGGDHI